MISPDGKKSFTFRHAISLVEVLILDITRQDRFGQHHFMCCSEWGDNSAGTNFLWGKIL